MKLLVINGPNLNMLGIREPEIYGSATLSDLCALIESHCAKKGAEVRFYQSNHEGDIVDKIQAAYGKMDGIIINPGAYTHTSVAIRDAISTVKIPTVEVHISDPDTREDFRHISFVREVCCATFKGLGFEGYLKAADLLIERCGK
ncbi:MAG: type II 3-dehydroquinate dehydratase [Oscillospiraceae bacterium]|jgi:3-dehydroquinate dehydratase-2